ncbi:MAG: hypothetical protein HOH04_10525 [Rhodospirillaceae bacterium]|nr:hypothetical protein [Rhodospirillaceae bacterium]
MLGLFSLPKILFTIAVIVAVWYGFKWFNRRSQVQQHRADEVGRGAASAAKAPDVEEMVLCPDCGAYVAKGGGHRCT